MKEDIYYGCPMSGMVCKNECRKACPNCGGKIAFQSMTEAMQLGFRPCIRCHPERLNWEGVREQLVHHAMEEIEENYNEKFSLVDLAHKMYINEDYLGRTFKQIVGETPLKFHHFVRCENARILLETKDNTVEMVAYTVGYVSVSHFIKRFKSLYGETPLQYKKKHEHEKVGIEIQIS